MKFIIRCRIYQTGRHLGQIRIIRFSGWARTGHRWALTRGWMQVVNDIIIIGLWILCGTGLRSRNHRDCQLVSNYLRCFSYPIIWYLLIRLQPLPIFVCSFSIYLFSLCLSPSLNCSGAINFENVPPRFVCLNLLTANVSNDSIQLWRVPLLPSMVAKRREWVDMVWGRIWKRMVRCRIRMMIFWRRGVEARWWAGLVSGSVWSRGSTFWIYNI